MTKEPHIVKTTMGEFLQEFLDEYELTQNKLSKLINVDSSRINLIINNKRGITVDTDIRLCKLFGLSEGYFLRIQEEMERKKIKFLKNDEISSIQLIKKYS